MHREEGGSEGWALVQEREQVLSRPGNRVLPPRTAAWEGGPAGRATLGGLTSGLSTWAV